MKRALWAMGVGAVLWCSGAVRADNPMRGTFFGERSEGWYWHEAPPLEEEATAPTETPPQQPPSLPVTQAVPVPGQPTAPSPEPPPLSAAWLREQIPRMRDRAYDDPTPENLKAFFSLQQYAMDKASTFAQVAQSVVIGDPYLDANARRPLASFAAQEIDREADREMRQVAKAILKGTGIWFFYSSTCPYCKQQVPVLAALKRSYGATVLPISMDGRAIEGGGLDGFMVNSGQAEMLGVATTPTMFLARPPNDFVPLGTGVLAEGTLIERIVEGAHAATWIPDEVYQKTRKVREVQLPPELAKGPEGIDPNDLSQLVRFLQGTGVGDRTASPGGLNMGADGGL